MNANPSASDSPALPRCEKGHDVPTAEHFCPLCGARVPGAHFRTTPGPLAPMTSRTTPSRESSARPMPSRHVYFTLGLLLLLLGFWLYRAGDQTASWDPSGPMGIGAGPSMALGGLSMMAGTVMVVGASVGAAAKTAPATRWAVGILTAIGLPTTLVGLLTVLSNYGYSGPGDTDESWNALFAVVLGWATILLGVALMAAAAFTAHRGKTRLRTRRA
jgi:uncharacterized membrane protein